MPVKQNHPNIPKTSIHKNFDKNETIIYTNRKMENFY